MMMMQLMHCFTQIRTANDDGLDAGDDNDDDNDEEEYDDDDDVDNEESRTLQQLMHPLLDTD